VTSGPIANPTVADIEVGATEGDLRYWLAKEAIRHGEVHLQSQQSNLIAMETRAGAIFGWSIPTILGLGTVASQGHHPGAAIGSAVCLAGAACACAWALWPQKWGHAGYRPGILLSEKLPSELEVLESIAAGYDETATVNDARLSRFWRWLRMAWILFLASPLVGGLTLAFATWA